MSKFYVSIQDGKANNPIENVTYDVKKLNIYPIAFDDLNDMCEIAKEYATKNDYDCVATYCERVANIVFVNTSKKDNSKIFTKKIRNFVIKELECDVVRMGVK